jgi:hypothetical protein
MFSALEFILGYVVPHNLLFPFTGVGMEIQRYHNVCCALTDCEPAAGLIVYSLCKNIIMK